MKLNEVCEHCGLKCTRDLNTSEPGKKPQYADPCLGILPGVLFSCCGHGKGHGYIWFKNGVSIRFEELTEVEATRMSKYHTFGRDTNRPDVPE